MGLVRWVGGTRWVSGARGALALPTFLPRRPARVRAGGGQAAAVLVVVAPIPHAPAPARDVRQVAGTEGSGTRRQVVDRERSRGGIHRCRHRPPGVCVEASRLCVRGVAAPVGKRVVRLRPPRGRRVRTDQRSTALRVGRARAVVAASPKYARQSARRKGLSSGREGIDVNHGITLDGNEDAKMHTTSRRCRRPHTRGQAREEERGMEDESGYV